jgi:hypothetical protein
MSEWVISLPLFALFLFAHSLTEEKLGKGNQFIREVVKDIVHG